jgi:hypothetical protein
LLHSSDIAVAALAGEDVGMSAKSGCVLPCPGKGAKCEFPFESDTAGAALAGEDVSMSAKFRCLPARSGGAKCKSALDSD